MCWYIARHVDVAQGWNCLLSTGAWSWGAWPEGAIACTSRMATFLTGPVNPCTTLLLHDGQGFKPYLSTVTWLSVWRTATISLPHPAAGMMSQLRISPLFCRPHVCLLAHVHRCPTKLSYSPGAAGALLRACADSWPSWSPPAHCFCWVRLARFGSFQLRCCGSLQGSVHKRHVWC